ncbi:hypothetical protein Leryth_001629 [Lithospermum erythrorhizon]|nr:hypothetical protein Leryth_001629 [Lithospermum erythrorhizon]
MAYALSSRSSSLSATQLLHPQKITEYSSVVTCNNKSTQTNVTCVYQAYIGGFWRNVTITWSKNLMNHCVTIYVDSIETETQSTCKIDLKPWHFWAKRGYKTFEVDEHQLEAYWDLRSATFSGSSPEPCAGYYVALIWEEEIVMLIGDYKRKAYKRTKARPSLVDAVFYYKKEHVFGKRSFATRAKFDLKNKEHYIVVESSTTGPSDPEMWISIDGVGLIHIKNLQWKFRGNQTVQVDKQPVQVFWDVYSWLFSTPGSSHGSFIFKPGEIGLDTDIEEGNRVVDSDDGNGESLFHSARSDSKFCMFLYAWKVE